MGIGTDIAGLLAKATKDFKVAMFNKVPKAMHCFTCEQDYRFKRNFEMYICSTQLAAEQGDVVIWKCPKCGKTKAEKTIKGDGGRFFFEARKMGLVHTE